MTAAVNKNVVLLIENLLSEFGGQICIHYQQAEDVWLTDWISPDSESAIMIKSIEEEYKTALGHNDLESSFLALVNLHKKHYSHKKTKLDDEIDALEKKLEDARFKKKLLMGESTVKCARCRKHIKAKDLLLRVHSYYVAPFSCNGGDYWTLPDDPDRSFICPYCHIVNRLFGNDKNSVYHKLKDYLRHEIVNDLEEKEWVNNRE